MPVKVSVGKVRSGRVYAVVHRADGAVEKLGLISFSHQNALINWTVNCYIKVKRGLQWLLS